MLSPFELRSDTSLSPTPTDRGRERCGGGATIALPLMWGQYLTVKSVIRDRSTVHRGPQMPNGHLTRVWERLAWGSARGSEFRKAAAWQCVRRQPKTQRSRVLVSVSMWPTSPPFKALLPRGHMLNYYARLFSAALKNFPLLSCVKNTPNVCVQKIAIY